MAKCLWCEKELPATEADTCTSCLFRSRDELSSSSKGDEDPAGVRINYDMSGLGEDEKSKTRKGKLASELNRDLFKNSAKEQNPFPNQEILMKKVKVHSNSMRNKLFVVGDGLVLDFDENGDAFVDESYVPVVSAYSRVRPGRLTVVEEAKPEPKPAPAPKKVEKVEEVKVEEKAEDAESKTEAKPRPAKKKAKKSFFKKNEE